MTNLHKYVISMYTFQHKDGFLDPHVNPYLIRNYKFIVPSFQRITPPPHPELILPVDVRNVKVLSTFKRMVKKHFIRFYCFILTPPNRWWPNCGCRRGGLG